MHRTKVVTLLSAAARTASTNGAAVPTSRRIEAIGGDIEGFSRHMDVVSDMTAVSGTNPTWDISIEGRLTSTDNWVALTPSSAWTQITAANEQRRRYEGPIPPEIRAVTTIGGTSTPTFTGSIKANLGG